MSTMERYQPLGFSESVCGKVIRFAISYMISRDAWLNHLRRHLQDLRTLAFRVPGREKSECKCRTEGAFRTPAQGREEAGALGIGGCCTLSPASPQPWSLVISC